MTKKKMEKPWWKMTWAKIRRADEELAKRDLAADRIAMPLFLRQQRQLDWGEPDEPRFFDNDCEGVPKDGKS